jgi:hypothetical protein
MTPPRVNTALTTESVSPHAHAQLAREPPQPQAEPAQRDSVRPERLGRRLSPRRLGGLAARDKRARPRARRRATCAGSQTCEDRCLSPSNERRIVRQLRLILTASAVAAVTALTPANGFRRQAGLRVPARVQPGCARPHGRGLRIPAALAGCDRRRAHRRGGDPGRCLVLRQERQRRRLRPVEQRFRDVGGCAPARRVPLQRRGRRFLGSLEALSRRLLTQRATCPSPACPSEIAFVSMSGHPLVASAA